MNHAVVLGALIGSVSLGIGASDGPDRAEPTWCTRETPMGAKARVACTLSATSTAPVTNPTGMGKHSLRQHLHIKFNILALPTEVTQADINHAMADLQVELHSHGIDADVEAPTEWILDSEFYVVRTGEQLRKMTGKHNDKPRLRLNIFVTELAGTGPLKGRTAVSTLPSNDTPGGVVIDKDAFRKGVWADARGHPQGSILAREIVRLLASTPVGDTQSRPQDGPPGINR